MDPEETVTIEPIRPPAPLAPLPKDATEAFVLWLQPKDNHKIGMLVVTSVTVGTWIEANRKANDQCWGAEPHPRTEKEHLLCEWARAKTLASAYLAQGDPRTTLEEQRAELVEWAYQHRIYLVHGKGGKL